MSSFDQAADRINAAVEKAEIGSKILSQVSNGDEFTEVPTTSGPVPSLKKWQKDNINFISGGVIARVDKAILSYPDYAAASAAAATLPDGQVVVSVGDEVTGVVSGGSISEEQSVYKVADYAKIRNYVGRGTRLRVIDPTGTHWWVRRGTREDNGGTVLKDALSRSWDRENVDHIRAEWFGAVGDFSFTTFTGTDNHVAMQAAASEASSTSLNLVFGTGNFHTTQPTVISTADEEDQGSRVSIIGNGAGNTCIVPNAVAAFDILGGTGAGWHMYTHHKGFRIRAVGGVGVGSGFKYNGAALFAMSDVVIENTNFGIEGNDVLLASLNNCVIRGNNYGIYGARSTRSYTNALTLNGCNLTGNKINGMLLFGPSSLSIFGGSVEGNGTMDGAGSAIDIINPGNEGATAITSVGVYYESNKGKADISVSSSGAGGKVAISVVGSTFNRVSGTDYTINNIFVDAEVGYSLSVTGCGFKGFNDYVPSTSRKYISATTSSPDGIDFHEAGNYYDSDLERPVVNYVNSGRLGSAFAIVKFEGATGNILSGRNVASVTRNTPGTYVLNLKSKLRGGGFVIASAPVGFTAHGGSSTETSVAVLCYNAAGSSTDPSVVTVVVFDGA